MRILLVSATAIAAASFVAPPPARAMTIAAPAGLGAALQQANIRQDVACVCGRRAYWGYSYYRPYAYSYAWPYAYSYSYTYAPYAYAYRPYAYRAYAYRPYAYGAYAYGGYGPRIWVGWGRW